MMRSTTLRLSIPVAIDVSVVEQGEALSAAPDRVGGALSLEGLQKSPVSAFCYFQVGARFANHAISDKSR